MKTRRILLFVLLAAVACVLWFYFHQPTGQTVVGPILVATTPANETNQKTDARRPIQKSQPAQPSNATADSSALTPENNPAAWIEKRRKQIEEEVQKGLNEWRTPIEFYGMVVDENTNAVSGVSIEFSCNDISSKGTSYYRTESDVNGLFSLNGVQGKLMVVRLSKPGYYTSKKDNDSFEYGDRYNHFVPDVGSPVVFHLRKKGIAEPLVVFEKTFQISISGKPLEIDLRTGMAVPPGQGNLIMEYVKQPPQNPNDHLYDWSFQIAVPNGGLLRSMNEFDFVAPVSGYEPSDLVEMKSSLGDDWQSRMKQQYFVRLPDGNFARVILDLMSHNGSLKVQAFVNPSGSRNLEFDPQQTLQSP